MTQPPAFHTPAPPPPSKSYAVLVVSLLAGVVVLLTVVGLGLWFLLDSGRDAAGDLSGSPSASETEHRVPADDGEPVTEVAIESLRLTEPPSGKDVEKCSYTELSQSERNSQQKDVGAPENGEKPASGTQEMTIATGLGELVIEVDNAKAPCTAASFDFLAGKKFFDGSHCHRLTTKDLFVLQCGDPSGTGTGGPSYRFKDEYVPKDTATDLTEEEMKAGEPPKPNYKAGDVAMANSGPDTNGSQFFIVYKDTYLPSAYTVFGELTSGMDIVEEVAADGAEIGPA